VALSQYDIDAKARREAAAAAYVSSPQFPAIEAEAARPGYRKATIKEIHASAAGSPGDVELSCWKGGLWASLMPSF
jgi:hypothetical protein